MANGQEDLMDRTLRWMTDNVRGAYTAVHPAGHPDAGAFSVNSGTCVLVCCYINALGKVLLKGGPPRRRGGQRTRKDFERFRELMDMLMPSWRLRREELNRAPLAHEEWRY